MKTALFLFGTRPEAIKLAPVILEMRKDPFFDVKICVTAQHREMLDQILTIFGITPDFDLDLMRPNQSLTSLTSRALEGIDECLKVTKPDFCIVQGDTTTVLAASLACFYNRTPVVHVEAGLRTYHKYSPYPEEINRVLTSHLTEVHFAPTPLAKANLLAERIPDSRIVVTGNTVIDALLLTRSRIEKGELAAGAPGIKEILSDDRRLVLVTTHRRENFGEGIEAICSALKKSAESFPDVSFVLPVHLNPNVKEPVHRILGNIPNVTLLPPLDYVSFVAVMNKSYLILTDSGGVQEEAPSLGKPVLVMRENTERPEAVQAGNALLVGTDPENIFENVRRLLTDAASYNRISSIANPFGDGKASKHIIAFLKNDKLCEEY